MVSSIGIGANNQWIKEMIVINDTQLRWPETHIADGPLLRFNLTNMLLVFSFLNKRQLCCLFRFFVNADVISWFIFGQKGISGSMASSHQQSNEQIKQ